MSQIPGGSSYTQLLNSAQGMYSGILSGYQNALSGQQQAQQGIQQGYNQLYGNVLGGIQGVQASQSQAIADQYTNAVGQQTQGMVNAGLGNTTVVNSVGRGLALDQSKAQVALSNQFAQLQAGYQSQLGLAALAYRGQSAQQNTALQQSQLGYQGQYQDALLRAGMTGYGIQSRYPASSGFGGAPSYSGQPMNLSAPSPGGSSAAAGARMPAGYVAGQALPSQPDDPYINLPAWGGIQQQYGQGFGGGGDWGYQPGPEEIPYGGGYGQSDYGGGGDF